MKYKTLLDQARAHATQAKTIAQAAADAGREMTDDERSMYATAMKNGADLHTQALAAKADAESLTKATELLGSLEDAADLGAAGKTRAAVTKSLGRQIVESDVYTTLAKSLPADPKNTHVHTSAIPVSLPGKAVPVFTGGSDTSAGAFVTPDYSGLVEMLGRRPLTLRDLVSKRTTASDVVYYVVQTAHTNNAAVVPEAVNADPIPGTRTAGEVAAAGLKPFGSWTFEQRSTNVETIAEMAAASKRALSDAQQLQSLIDDELNADLNEEEEDQLLNGSGSANGQLRGITQTPGRQGQLWDTDILTTLRKAKTKARVGGRVRNIAMVINPEDEERIDLLRENGATGAFLGGGPWGQENAGPWGMTKVVSESIAAGQALVGGFDKAVLWDREATTVNMTDSHEDFFARNLVAILAEKRLAFAVTRPSAFVDVDLTA